MCTQMNVHVLNMYINTTITVGDKHINTCMHLHIHTDTLASALINLSDSNLLL